MTDRACLEQVSPPVDHRVERPHVDSGQPLERSGAHGRGRLYPALARGSVGVAHVAPRWCLASESDPCCSGAWLLCLPILRADCSVRAAERCRRVVDGGVPGVSERGGDPPGPIPNPVVPPASAGGVLGGQLPGKRGPRAWHPLPHHRSLVFLPSVSLPVCRGVEQRQLVGLITQRSWVRIPPPLPFFLMTSENATQPGSVFVCLE
jgi:hypothetical protein